jgi:hypothetical protein
MELLGDDGVKHLDLIFDQMLKDLDEIKLALISQLPAICEFLQKRETGYQEILKHVMKALKILLSSPSLEVFIFILEKIED